MAAVGIAAARHPALQSQGDPLPPVCVARIGLEGCCCYRRESGSFSTLARP